MSEGRNYADHPKSVGEIKSDKTESCADWTPRDVLISMLREIDSGEIAPEMLVVAWAKRNESGTMHTRYQLSSRNIMEALGLCVRTAHRIQILGDDG